MRGKLVLIPLALVAGLVIGCGGGDSGFTEEEVAEAADLRFEGNDYLYESSDGDCVVLNVLTSSGAVEDAESESEGELSGGVATNPDGDAGLEFGGTFSADVDECVDDAEQDLESLGSE